MNAGRRFIAYLTLVWMFFSIFPSSYNAKAFNTPIDPNFILKAEGHCGYVALEWTPVSGANYYYVYRGIGEGNQHSMPLTDFPIKNNFYRDGSDIKEDVKYCYYIRAVGSDHKEFLQSTEACAIPTCSSSNPCKEDPIEEDCTLSLKYQVENKNYWVNNVQKGPMEAAPEIRWSRMFLVIRYVTQEVGATIGWDGANRIVTIVTLAGNKLEFQIGNNKYKLNGIEDFVDPNNTEVVPYIVAGRTMIPLRRTGEALDAKDIIWDGNQRIAELLFEDPDCGCTSRCPYPEHTASNKKLILASNCEMRYIPAPSRQTTANVLTHIEPKGIRSIPRQEIENGFGGTLQPLTPKLNELYRGGACWVYQLLPDSGTWKAPTKEQKSLYRHKFCTEGCTEVRLEIYSYGNVEVFLDGISPAHKVGQVMGNGPNSAILEFIIPSGGTHYLYFVHHIIPNRPAGLIYGATFKPCEEKPPLDLGNAQYCDGIHLFCAEVIESCVGQKVKVKLPHGAVVTVDVSALALTHNPCAAMQPGSHWYIGGQAVGGEFHASYLHLNKEPCDKEELQRLRCLCFEVTSVDRDAYIITGIINGVEMKFSFFAHQGQWLWGALHIDQIKEGHCYKVWVVSKPAYLPPKIFFFKEVECPCGDDEECVWTPQGRIVSSRWDEADRTWVIGFLPCDAVDREADDDIIFLYTPTDLLDLSGTFPISQSTKLCARFCLDKETKKIIKWEVMPEPCCPKEENKLCGCIVRMTLKPDAQDNYQVYIKKDCSLNDPAYDIVLNVPASLLDSNLGLDVLSYFQMFPEPDRYKKDTVCVEMVFNSSNLVTEWKAFPDRDPCCKEKPDCQWTQNGYLVSITPKENADGTLYWEVIAKGCNGEVKDFILFTDPNTFFAINAPNWPLSQAGDHCLRLCLRQLPTPTHVAYEIIAWEIVEGECCPEEKKLCGCIIRMTLDPDANGNYKIYIKKDCKPPQPGQPAFDIALDIPSTLLDEIYNINALTYFNMMPGNAPKYNVCVDLIYNSSNQVIKWWAHPDRDPCCKEEELDCEWTPNGYIVDIVQVNDKMFTVQYKDCDGNLKNFILNKNPNTFTALSYPDIPLSQAGDRCVRFCIKQADVATHVAYEIIAWDLVEGECCPEDKMGRIQVKMPKECLDGTIVTIYDASGNEVWKGKHNPDTGIFDTGCKLPCPGTYKVVPRNEKCKFFPEAAEVQMSERMCCNDYINVVAFKCECESEQKYGRIQVKMPTECLDETIVSIYDASGNEVWKGKHTPGTAIFDTDCKLPCPGTYKVVPRNEKCKFYPESVEVRMTERMCCDYINVVEFKCECESEQKYGRIQVKMPKECLDGTIVTIYDASGNEVWKGRHNPDLGFFDTGCRLPCPGNYTIVPKNEKCNFYPEMARVQMTERMCCDYINVVEFKCECESEQKYGRIQVKMPLVCSEGTVIHIYDASGKEVWTGRVSPNNGIADTDCKLPCPGTYKVVPKNEKCKFYPESAEVRMSERMCCDYINVVEFKCECESEQKYGRIQVKMPKECLEGTIVSIYDANNKEVWKGSYSANLGFFDTGCRLPCPGTYKVVPRNEKCKFYPESAEVRMSERMCCDYINVVEFNCECESEQKKGRIQVKMPKECLEGTIVTIYAGNTDEVVWSGEVNSRTGIFDTGCNIPCPGIYKVVPRNKNCKFTPEAAGVNMSERMCCDYINVVEFKCECKTDQKMGRIQISMPKECLEGTIVTIYDSNNKEAWKGRFNPNLGLFDTGCTLPCPGTYRVVPRNDKCKFSPETYSVVMSEKTCCDYINKIEFKCSCGDRDDQILQTQIPSKYWFSSLLLIIRRMFFF